MANVWNAMKKHEREQAERQAEPKPSTVTDAPVRIADQKVKAAKAKKPSTPASMPADVGNNYAEVLVAHHDRGSRIAEEYRELRTSLLAQSRDERFCYLITSANPSEGKTVSCLNLSLVMAERQERTTIVVDCDLRKGMVAKMLNSTATSGVAEILRGQASVKEVVQPTVYPNLFYVAAGKARQEEVGDLLARPEIHEMVAELRRRYDYVLFDTPPINMVSDARMLGSAAMDALLVVRMNKTHRESVDKAIGLLHAANIKVAGLILTHQRYFIPNYLYRYS